MEYKSLTITLSRLELLSDMEEITFITADAMTVQDEKMRSTIQDIAQDGRIGRTTTCLNKAWGELLHSITAYTKNGMTEDVSTNNDYKEPDTYDVTLRMPVSFSNNSVEAVKNAMHSYLVCRAVSYWFSIVKKDEAEMYMAMSDEELMRVKMYLNTRVIPTRLKMSVF